MTDILEGLNPAQRQAAETIEGPLLILAGPGSGKTRVITHRIAYLVKVVGINPHRIMAVTFTNKAAKEMRERLQELLAGSVEHLYRGHLPRPCAAHPAPRRQGDGPDLEVRHLRRRRPDQPHQAQPSGPGPRPQAVPAETFQNAISSAKSQILTPEHFSQRSHSYFEEVVSRVYRRYEKLLAQSQALDFDDLLMKACQLFENHPDVLEKYQSRYLHLLVDEFQDTNITQYALVRQMAGKHRNICVVGDPDQSIYSWRSADIRNILNFEKDYPEAKVVLPGAELPLHQDHPGGGASGRLSEQESQREALWTDNEEGKPLRVVETFNE